LKSRGCAPPDTMAKSECWKLAVHSRLKTISPSRDCLRLAIPELHGIGISSIPIPDFIKRAADIRENRYQVDYFDTILCVSTIEYVGVGIIPDTMSPSMVNDSANQEMTFCQPPPIIKLRPNRTERQTNCNETGADLNEVSLDSTPTGPRLTTQEL
jgi:hypothetical protein